MEASKKLKKLYADEKKAREAAKTMKKNTKALKEPAYITVFRELKKLAIILFYTVFFAAFAYVVITVFTSSIPILMGYIVGSMGYTLESAAEIMLASLSGLFFTAWTFVISFFIIRRAFKAYTKGVRRVRKGVSSDDTNSTSK